MDDLPFPEVFAVDSFTTANSKYQQEKHRSFINKWFFFVLQLLLFFSFLVIWHRTKAVTLSQEYLICKMWKWL